MGWWWRDLRHLVGKENLPIRGRVKESDAVPDGKGQEYGNPETNGELLC
jgi:hypothetical protein